MRAALIAIMVLLLPAALFAGSTMGIYFDYRAHMTHSPTPGEMFNGYVYGDNLECYVTGVEFALDSVPGISVVGINISPGILFIGHPYHGISIAYWPPLNGFYPGYNLLCTITFQAVTNWCVQSGGSLYDAPLAVIPDPDSQFLGETCWPEANEIPITGLTSIICPHEIRTESKSWGAIKSLF